MFKEAFSSFFRRQLLAESPDGVIYNGVRLNYTSPSGVPFVVASVKFEDGSTKRGMFWLTGYSPANRMHEVLLGICLIVPAPVNFESIWEIEQFRQTKQNVDFWHCEPAELKNELIEAYDGFIEKMKRGKAWQAVKPPYTVESLQEIYTKELNPPMGRYWKTIIKGEKVFLVSVSMGDEKEIKHYLKKMLPVWNKEGHKFYYQPKGKEDGFWMDGDEFLGSAVTEQPILSPEESKRVKELEAKINKILPVLHLKTGIEKQKLKRELRGYYSEIDKIKGVLGSESAEDSMEGQGSIKAGETAGSMSVAQMRAMERTSESLLGNRRDIQHQLLEEAYQAVLLSELFDTSPEKANVKWNLSDKRFIEATFNGPNDRTYHMSLADYQNVRSEGDDWLKRDFGEKQQDFLKKGTYLVEFGDTTGDTNNPEYNILGTGGTSSSKVFGIVINAVEQLTRNNPRVIRNLIFSAKEPSRIKMYERLLPLLATKFDKIPFTNAKGNTFYLVDKSIPR